jgi:hypothetical protein
MSCFYFKIKNDIGVCGASSDTHTPGIDEMSCFCFKDEYCACSIFSDCLAAIDVHVIKTGIGIYSLQHVSALKY